ncbi:MAG: hypothetical protein WEB53_15360 [Akkermansiaceae bacterium]
MKNKNHTSAGMFLVAILAGSFHATAAVSSIYEDTFSGTSGTTLSGQAPTVRPGTETWSFNSATSFATGFQADGTASAGGVLAAGRVAALLPFTPAAGNTYTLSATISATTASGQWLALGFADKLTGDSGLFAFGNVNGVSWMLKGDTGSSALQGFAGPQTGGLIVNTFAGGAVNLSIVLDTTGSLWKTSMFNGATQLGSTFTYAANPTILGVGFSKHESVSGSIDNFKLQVEPIPEPSSLLLGLFGLTFLLPRRRP